MQIFCWCTWMFWLHGSRLICSLNLNRHLYPQSKRAVDQATLNCHSQCCMQWEGGVGPEQSAVQVQHLSFVCIKTCPAWENASRSTDVMWLSWRPAKTFHLFETTTIASFCVFLSNLKFVSLAWGISVPTRNVSWRLFIYSQFLKFASSLQNCSSITSMPFCQCQSGTLCATATQIMLCDCI